MSERDPISDLDRLRNLPIRSEEIGFAPDAMIACAKCGRSNPPNRPDCMYCGAAREGSTAEPRLDLRVLESWENGFNVFVTNSGAGDARESAAQMLAGLLLTEPAVMLSILESRLVLPVARLESKTQAEIITGKLARFGIETRVLRDDVLALGQKPVRLRGLEFDEEALVLKFFGKSETERLRRDDLGLIVSGIILEGRTESLGKRKSRRTVTRSETLTSSDEPVIDIYSRQSRTGWRIRASGFDFSCIGADKSLLVAENMERLISKLANYSPTAKVVHDYAKIRSLLEHCWPSEARKDALGLQRTGFVRRDLSTVLTTNNLVQLTKYSRLQWHLL